MQKAPTIDIRHKDVDKFLRKIDKKAQIKIFGVFESIEILGIEKHLRTQDIKKIKGIKESLYEIKVKSGSEYRFLGVISDNSFLIVHAFIKKTQKDINKEINLAIKRLKNIN